MSQALFTEFDTRIDAGCVVCVDDENAILENHSILIKDGKILEISPTDTLDECSVNEHYCLPDHVVMPGLINAHGHASMSLLRGIANDIPLQEWLEKHIWPAEGQWVDTKFVEDGAQLAIAEMLKTGTTTFSDMYFFPETVASVAITNGMRVQLCCPILDFPTPWGSGPDEYIRKTLELEEQYANNPLVQIAFGPHAPYTVSDAPLKTVAQLAKEKDIPVQMHIHETQQELDDALSQRDQRPILRLNDLGLIDKSINLQAVHMTALEQEEISLVSKLGVHVIHCPESNMKLASGFCPVQDLIDAGANVALGTDGAASNNDLDMFGEMRTAALIAKGFTGDASAVSSTTALQMATINGAKALGMSHNVGSIEVGKIADLIAIDMQHLSTTPSYDIEADLVYNTSSSQVTHSWVAGKLLLDCGQLTKADEFELIEKSRAWAQKISDGEK